ncbi:MAG: MerR family transcriptional regulator [Longibaculum sp.]
MYYTIGEVAKMFNLTPSTIRYYDKEGLLPFVERQSGIRRFSDEDINMLKTIECLKETGMPIKDIKTFSQWCLEGDQTLEQRQQMFYQRREIVKQQMADLQDILDHIEYKCDYYDKAVANKKKENHF